jgi:hypothetical protein
VLAFGCLGHWYVQILFGAPSAGIMLVMGRDSLRKRLRNRHSDTEPTTPEQ